ncbi:MAG TPA: hypothetical protein VI299_28680, partial [Polyangiales bacterium]
MRTNSLLTLSTVLAGSVLATTAHAHINVVGDILARGGDQKLFPCDGDRSRGPVYTFEPGSTIKLQVSENIPHPGYFRIAFDKDGQDDFMDPRS